MSNLNKVAKAIENQANSGVVCQSVMLQAVKTDQPSIAEAANQLAEKYGEDKKAVNGRLSIIRKQMERSCKELDVAKLTVLKDRETDVYKVVESNGSKGRTEGAKDAQKVLNDLQTLINTLEGEPLDAVRVSISKMFDVRLEELTKPEETKKAA